MTDDGLDVRQTSLEALAGLRTNRDGDDAVHTAGTSSQISDGAGALMLMGEDTAEQPRARLVDSVLVGC